MAHPTEQRRGAGAVIEPDVELVDAGLLARIVEVIRGHAGQVLRRIKGHQFRRGGVDRRSRDDIVRQRRVTVAARVEDHRLR